MPFGADPYATVDDLRKGLGGVASTALDQGAADLALESASDQIDGWCGRRFDSIDGTRDLRTSNPGRVRLPDAVAVTDVQVRRSPGSEWTALRTGRAAERDGDGDYRLDADGNPITYVAPDWELQRSPRFGDDHPYTSLVSPFNRFPCARFGQPFDNVRVTGTFGWEAVPVAVKQATVILAARLMGRGATPYGAQDIGAVTVYVRLDDPDVLRLLRAYRRRSLGV